MITGGHNYKEAVLYADAKYKTELVNTYHRFEDTAKYLPPAPTFLIPKFSLYDYFFGKKDYIIEIGKTIFDWEDL